MQQTLVPIALIIIVALSVYASSGIETLVNNLRSNSGISKDHERALLIVALATLLTCMLSLAALVVIAFSALPAPTDPVTMAKEAARVAEALGL